MNIYSTVLALLLAPALYFVYKRMFQDKYKRGHCPALKLALERMKRRHRLLISEIDFLKNKLIALDRRNNKIILIVHKNNITWEKCLSMAELGFCRINKNVNQLTGYTCHVALELLSGNSAELAQFTFYDDDDDNAHEFTSRIKKANDWKKKIQLHLNSIKE